MLFSHLKYKEYGSEKYNATFSKFIQLVNISILFGKLKKSTFIFNYNRKQKQQKERKREREEGKKEGKKENHILGEISFFTFLKSLTIKTVEEK